MHPTSFSCARCGMASTVDRQRCRECGAQRFVAPSPAGSARTGPAAAEAWAASRAVARGTEPVREGESTVSSRLPAHPVGPWAVVAWRSLHVVILAAIACAAVGAGRLVLVVATENQADLLTEGSWDTLADVATVAGAVLAASMVIAAWLVLAWGALAGRNARRLHLDAGAWTRSIERAGGRVAVAAALAVVWRRAPNGPEQLDRVVDLGAGALTMVAVVLAVGAVQQLLLVVTATELQRAEWLLRLDEASMPRPKDRGTAVT